MLFQIAWLRRISDAFRIVRECGAERFVVSQRYVIGIRTVTKLGR